jgi:hypothetical protein
MPVSDAVAEGNEQLASDQRWALVNRIAASQHLKGSPRLCEFLFYIARCAIRDAPEDATEQQIGIRVFGRAPGYNSSEDSIVRTHARLLRQKLASYFAEEGHAEELLLDVPKGHYLPVFHTRNQSPVVVAEPSLALSHPSAPVEEPHLEVVAPVVSPRRWPVLVALALAIVFTAAALLLTWRGHIPSPAENAADAFWRPFLNTDPPLVIYSNALFEGDSIHGLRYANPSPGQQPEADGLIDTYTGVGELSSVYTLTRFFDRHHANFILKRSLLVTWDEAQSRNLIFIGSRAENPSLRVLQPTTDFTMTASPDSAGVVNVHPLPGEPAVFSRPEHPLTRDYAILALLPGVQPGKHMVVFSGLMTFGTQAAVDYVSNPETAAILMSKIAGPKGEVRPFEAVLETSIGGGVPMQTHLVAIRVH